MKDVSKVITEVNKREERIKWNKEQWHIYFPILAGRLEINKNIAKVYYKVNKQLDILLKAQVTNSKSKYIF